ncbi:uncharacterized protein LY79DRAFT_340421 [Colletotrichum navitas]|uniref:Uncharacterized protein n=1 Tax=Colletotrichum navitas TaxID=681940 RepID=A0AAD8V197_9PEZI|nr:uncharacterized protein LY79DRAFT_340421 [Colletotrichum navitas]KAK1579517.1 hypothetical protein LY79DRAFT_340421 [Colletotrichum navitas]
MTPTAVCLSASPRSGDAATPTHRLFHLALPPGIRRTRPAAPRDTGVFTPTSDLQRADTCWPKQVYRQLNVRVLFRVLVKHSTVESNLLHTDAYQVGKTKLLRLVVKINSPYRLRGDRLEPGPTLGVQNPSPQHGSRMQRAKVQMPTTRTVKLAIRFWALLAPGILLIIVPKTKTVWFGIYTATIVLGGNLQLAWTISGRIILFGIVNDVFRSLIAFEQHALRCTAQRAPGLVLSSAMIS